MKFSYRLWLRIVKKYAQQKSYLFSLFILLFSGFSSLQADDPTLAPTMHRTGAIPLTDEQLQEIQDTWPRVIGVRLNAYGAARVNEYMNEQGFPVGDLPTAVAQEEEFLTNQNTTLAAFLDYQEELSGVSLPSAVDNSKLPCFPPIGDQGQQGSCVAWASTYYHATHEYGLLNGINNKTSPQGIRSPKWTYNMLNFGEDAGAYPQDAYLLLGSNGAPSSVDFPYNSNFREWDLKIQDWISALSYRMGTAQFLNIDVPADINTIKQILNNGHIVTFVTFAYSWQLTRVKADPAQTNNPYAGQNAISWMQGTSGGHHTSIVGYDDNVWIDVNNNGQVDSGEKGAFLLANSWGSGWANNGFIWVSYDAFFNNSAVVNGPTNGRQKIAQMLFSIVPKSANYTPKAVAKFSLSQSARNQLKLSSGVSNTTASVPSRTFLSGALSNDGGAYAFNGQTASLQTATFALDLTDLLPSVDSLQRYYLVTEDLAVGNPTTFNSYSIMDLVNNREVPYAGPGVTFDKSVILPYIDFQFSNNNVDNTPPTVHITNPSPSTTISGTVMVTASATDNVGVTRVEFYVDSVVVGVNSTAPPYVVSLNTTTLTNGPHTIRVIAFDAANNQAQDQITVNVNNVTDTTPPTLQIQSPANGSTVSGSVTFSVTASDDTGVKQVELYVDSALVQTVTNPPFTVLVNTTSLSNGQHTFKAIAYDTSNNSAQQTVSVNVQNTSVDNTPPTVQIQSPPNASTVSGTILFSALATDNVAVKQVEFYVDSVLQRRITTPPYTVGIDTTRLVNGQHSFQAIAYDTSNNTARQTISVNIQNSSVDTTPPTVQIQSPANGSTVSGTVTFSAMAADNVAVKQVDFNVDGALQQRVTTPPYTVSVDTRTLTNGQHSFQAIAYDTANNTAQQTVSVSVQNQGGGIPPTVVITAPRNNTYVGGTILVNVSATDDIKVARVELYVDCKIWNVDLTAPYTFMVNTGTLSQGPHALTAIAYDDEGNFGQNTIVINVQN